MERDFKGVWIPKEIWLDKRLCLPEKYYYSLYLMNNDVNDTEAIMSDIYSKNTILTIRKKLNDMGYIHTISSPEEAKRITISLNNTGKRCEWCRKRNYILHEHHYPIPKSKGGTETVLICPNCHATYHSILKE